MLEIIDIGVPTRLCYQNAGYYDEMVRVNQGRLPGGDLLHG